MPWVLLVIAGILEATWVTCLKLTHDSERIWPKLVVFAISIASFVLMERVTKTLPSSTSYAVWTGIGAVGTTIVGVLLHKEPVTAIRIACVGIVVAGVIGLKFTTPNS